MKTTALNPAAQLPPPVVVSDPQPISFVGRIFIYVRDNSARSQLTREVSQPSTSHTHSVSEERTQYLTFCKHAGFSQPVFVSVDQSHDEKTYNHYAAYCAQIGVESPSRERWERIKDDGWKWFESEVGPELRFRRTLKEVVETTEQDSFLETLCNDKRKPTRRDRQTYFPAMMNVEVGVKDSAVCDPKESYEARTITRVDTVVEALTRDRQRYSRCTHCATEFVNKKGVQTLSAFAFCDETSLTFGQCKRDWLAQTEHQPACVTRTAERPITFDKHLARSANRPTLQTVNRVEKATEHNSWFGWPMWEYRNNLDVATIVNREVKDPLKTTGLESVLCRKCFEYVGQVHRCLPTMVTCYAGPGGFYPLEQKAGQLLLADVLRREQEHLQRVAEFKKTNPIMHKVAWDKSVGEQFVGRTPIDVVDRAEVDPEVMKPSIRPLFDGIGNDERSAYLRKNLRRAIVVDDLLRLASFAPCIPQHKTHYVAVQPFTFPTSTKFLRCLFGKKAVWLKPSDHKCSMSATGIVEMIR